MNKIIVGVDKNQLIGSHGASNRRKHRQMMEEGASLLPLPLPFGDYILVDDDIVDFIEENGLQNIRKKDLAGLIRLSVDTKKNLLEVCQNVCQDHERFVRELVKPLKEENARLIILIEEDGIETLEDVYFWDNPRLKVSPRATKGTSLYKSLCTIRDEYNVEILFCSRSETGKKIIEILKGESTCDGKAT